MQVAAPFPVTVGASAFAELSASTLPEALPPTLASLPAWPPPSSPAPLVGPPPFSPLPEPLLAPEGAVPDWAPELAPLPLLATWTPPEEPPPLDELPVLFPGVLAVPHATPRTTTQSAIDDLMR
jgi:hypothetical protein